MIFTAFVVYASVFVVLYLSRSAYRVAATSSKVIVKRTSDAGAPSRAGGESAPLLNKPWAKVEAAETVVYKRRDPHPMRSLVFGLPSPSNRKLTLITFAINALLALATWDLTFRSHYFYRQEDLSFARIGFVGPHSAKLLVREPRSDKWPVTVWYSPEEEKVKTNLVDSIPKLGNETDYTAAIQISRLEPETKYRYFTSSNHTGTFTTAPPLGQPPSSGHLTFLTSSCIKQRFPYSPFQHPLSIKGFQILGGLLDELKASFMLFLGDFIYIDV